MKSYLVSVTISNCLLTAEAKKKSPYIIDKFVNQFACILALTVKAESTRDAKEKARAFLDTEPNFRSLITNTQDNPVCYEFDYVSSFGVANEPATIKISPNSLLFYDPNEKGDEPHDQAGMARLPQAVKYEKISKDELLNNGEPIWNPVLCTHIQNSISLAYDESDADLVDALPEPVKHLYYLWAFQCEVGGNGIDSFVLQRSAHEIKGCYQALQIVGDEKLAAALAVGIARTIESDEEGLAEYRYTASDLSWFDTFKGKSKGLALHKIDDAFDVFELANDALDSNIIRYIKANLSHIAI
ncbi:DMP19 family protein [Arenicella chitinivorans]|nr:hypothetical protein [Arenicella chitinivorans]